MNKHVMLDLETLSTKPNAMILSIGAVSFDPNGTGILERFHCAIDTTALNASTAHLFDIDPGTVAWWMDPHRDSARAHLNAQIKVDLPSALFAFDEWLDTVRGPEAGNEVCIWGNAATFDNTILRRSYELIGMVAPWKFWSDRCYRTMKNLGHTVGLPAIESDAVPHTALFDAHRQAVHLQLILDINGITVP